MILLALVILKVDKGILLVCILFGQEYVVKNQKEGFYMNCGVKILTIIREIIYF